MLHSSGICYTPESSQEGNLPGSVMTYSQAVLRACCVMRQVRAGMEPLPGRAPAVRLGRCADLPVGHHRDHQGRGLPAGQRHLHRPRWRRGGGMPATTCDSNHKSMPCLLSSKLLQPDAGFCTLSFSAMVSPPKEWQSMIKSAHLLSQWRMRPRACVRA